LFFGFWFDDFRFTGVIAAFFDFGDWCLGYRLGLSYTLGGLLLDWLLFFFRTAI
jgi:hypothetical protein